jgi:hypothetical protein
MPKSIRVMLLLFTAVLISATSIHAQNIPSDYEEVLTILGKILKTAF